MDANPNPYREGDIFTEANGRKHQVLGVCGDIVFISKHSRSGNFTKARSSNYHWEELAKRTRARGENKWTCSSSSGEGTVEVTLEQIADWQECDVADVRVME